MDGKVIAITGGAQGIGLETAKLLVSRGAKVSVADLDEAKLASAQEQFKTFGKQDNVRFQKLNVADPKRVDGWIKDTVQWGGQLDAAVNAAGINCSESGQPSLADTSDERWDVLLQTNLSVSGVASMVSLMRSLAQGMFYCLRSELNNIKDGGSIVCISSVQGLMGFPTSAAYAATKHGVIGLVRSAAKENGERNVRVNAVAPYAPSTKLLQDTIADLDPVALLTPKWFLKKTATTSGHQ